MHAETSRPFPRASVQLSIYSPPFGGLYHYSSSERDLSNSADYQQFFAHYEFVVRELSRLTMPGRMTAVHCMDVPTGNTGRDHLIDFPATLFGCTSATAFATPPATPFGRNHWPSAIARWRRTSRIGPSLRIHPDAALHRRIIYFYSAAMGENPVPIAHPVGLLDYAGARMPPNSEYKTVDWQPDRESLFALDLATVCLSILGRHSAWPRAAVPRGARRRRKTRPSVAA